MGEQRLNRITTRTGDDGSTGLADGERLRKSALRCNAIGDVDELNAALGLLCVVPGIPAAFAGDLREIQHRLFELGGELSLPGRALLGDDALALLDDGIARWNALLPPLAEFVLPGSCEASARAHLARAVCRRAERTLWQLHEEEPACTRDVPARYLNRLSDWLFVASRLLARNSGTETLWRGLDPI